MTSDHSPACNIDIFESLSLEAPEELWCARLFDIGLALGFHRTLVALLPKTTSKVEDAFLRSNHPPEWRDYYDQNRLAYVDPTVIHCVRSSTPIVWTPELFLSANQQEIYDKACQYGLRSGVSLPMHGPRSEVGILSFASDQHPDPEMLAMIKSLLPTLTFLRDMTLDRCIAFCTPIGDATPPPNLTTRELECLKWTAAGKSTWEISRILSCSESAVNFHITNLRGKLDAPTRRDAVVKAIRVGILSVG